jgi:hypothetical protein
MARKDSAGKSVFAVSPIAKCLPRSQQDVGLAEMIATGGRGRGGPSSQQGALAMRTVEVARFWTRQNPMRWKLRQHEGLQFVAIGHSPALFGGISRRNE